MEDNVPRLSVALLLQQCFYVAMDQQRDVGLDPGGSFKLRALTCIEFFDELARHLRFSHQEFDLGIGIFRAVERWFAHRN
jgi:hypothetical protein